MASPEASGPCHSTIQTQLSEMHIRRSRNTQPGFCASSCHRVGQRGHPAGHRMVIEEVVESQRIGSSAGYQSRSTSTTAAEGPSFSEAPVPLLGPVAMWSKSKEYWTVDMLVFRTPARAFGSGSERFVDTCQPDGIGKLQGTSSETKSRVGSSTSGPVQLAIRMAKTERTAPRRAITQGVTPHALRTFLAPYSSAGRLRTRSHLGGSRRSLVPSTIRVGGNAGRQSASARPP
jgi:hypothetical protein